MSSEIFGRGGAQEAADELGIEFLGDIELDAEVRQGADSGIPIVAGAPDSSQARAFRHLAEQVAARCSVLRWSADIGAVA